jgi:CheY-like chemotaxis protein
MLDKWDSHVVRLKEQISELREQIAELKSTLHIIGTDVASQRELLAQLTRSVRSSLDQVGDAEPANQLQSVLKVLDNPDVGAIVVGPDGRNLLFNDIAQDLVGFAASKNFNPSSSDPRGIFLADKVTRCKFEDYPWQQCAHGKATQELVLFVKFGDPTDGMDGMDGIWLRTVSMPILNNQNQSKGAVAFLLDTTEQTIVEEQVKLLLATLEQQLTAIETAQNLLIQLTTKLSEPKILDRLKKFTSYAEASSELSRDALATRLPQASNEANGAGAGNQVVSSQVSGQSVPAKSAAVPGSNQIQAATATSPSVASVVSDGQVAGTQAHTALPATGQQKNAAPAPPSQSTSGAAAAGGSSAGGIGQPAQGAAAVSPIASSGSAAAPNTTPPELRPRVSASAPGAVPNASLSAHAVGEQRVAPVTQAARLSDALTQTAFEATTSGSQSAVHEFKPEQPKKVLIVDDIAVNQKLLRLQLRRLGCEIDVACNGKEAVESVEKKDYDIIFMDLDMPIMDGPTATTKIRAMEGATGKHVPIVAVTSYKRDVDRERCMKAGMDDYLIKGCSQAQLMDVISKFARQVISAGIGREELVKPVLPIQPLNDDIVNLRSLQGKEEMQEVTRLFSSSVKTFVDCLELAVQEKKVEAVGHFCHCIEGPAAAMGLKRLSVIVTEMMIASEEGNWSRVSFCYERLKQHFTQLLMSLSETSPAFQST